MEITNEKQMVVTDENGNESVMNILFTYENEERGTKYVFFYPANDENSEVLVMKYTDDGELIDIEDDEEYDEVFEVFEAWQEDPKIQELKDEK